MRIIRIDVAAIVVAATVAHVASQAPASQRSAAPGTAVIFGRVTDATTGAPVEGASVSLWLQGGDLTQFRQVTDAQGRFLYLNVRAGSYNLVPERAGYMQGGYGQARPGGDRALIDVADGQRLMDVTLKLWPPTYIGGTVTDEKGEPVVGVTVQTLLRRPSVRTIGRWAYAYGGGETQTDDRGRYRLGANDGDMIVFVPGAVFAAVSDGAQINALTSVTVQFTPSAPLGPSPALPVGDLSLHLLSATRPSLLPPPPASDGILYVYPTTFYPAARTSMDATPIHAQSGRSRDDVDIQLHLVPARRVTGRVIGPDGPAKNVPVRLVPRYSDQDFADGRDYQTASGLTDGTGRFTLIGAPDGDYVLSVLQSPRPRASQSAVANAATGTATAMAASNASAAPQVDGPTWWARVPVSVAGADVSGVELTLARGLHVSGTMVFDGAAQPSADTIAHRAVALGARGTAVVIYGGGRVTPDRHFTTGEYPPGRYDVNVLTGGGWYVRSVTYQGRDVTDRGLDLTGADLDGIVVTMTDKIGSVAGTARTAAGDADASALVVIFPVDYATVDGGAFNTSRFRTGKTNRAGHYLISNVAAGDYWLAAIDDAQSADWLDLARLKTIAQTAARISVGEGQTAQQDPRRGGSR